VPLEVERPALPIRFEDEPACGAPLFGVKAIRHGYSHDALGPTIAGEV
jgi:hypothetical protein